MKQCWVDSIQRSFITLLFIRVWRRDKKSGWWITSLSHQVKVKHAGSAGVLQRMYSEYLNWNQFSWKIRAACHNGFYLTPINIRIDLTEESNLGRTRREEKGYTNIWAQLKQKYQQREWQLFIHHFTSLSHGKSGNWRTEKDLSLKNKLINKIFQQQNNPWLRPNSHPNL